MEEKVIRQVSYRVWDESRQDDRIFSGALRDGDETDKRNKVEVCTDGGSFDVAIEDIPLLVKVLNEFN